MERLLVVGSSGLLGSRIMKLAEGRYETFGTYNDTAVHGSQKLDVSDREEVFALANRIKPDFVIDTHAITNIDYCETHQEEAWRINVEGAKNVADACGRSGSKYVFLSTDNVFDGKKSEYTENDLPRPLNYYAKTKTAMENALESLDVNYVIVRTSVMYGIGGSGKVSFPVWLMNKLKSNESVKIVTDQKNNPTFADNLAEFIFSFCKKDKRGMFHVTGDECISRYDFSLRIAELLGLDKSLITPIKSEELGQVGPRPNCVNMISRKAELATGLRTLSVDEGLAIFKKQVETR